MKHHTSFLLTLSFAVLISTTAFCQDGPGPGFGRGRGPGGGGRGLGRGAQQHGHAAESQHGADDRDNEDHKVFQFLLENHKKIKRTVKELPNGVETLTESDAPEIAAKIKEHVEWMEYRC